MALLAPHDSNAHNLFKSEPGTCWSTDLHDQEVNAAPTPAQRVMRSKRGEENLYNSLKTFYNVFIRICIIYLPKFSLRKRREVLAQHFSYSCYKRKKNESVNLEGYQGTVTSQSKDRAFLEWCNQYGWETITFGLGWGVWIIVSQAIPMCTPCANLNFS